MALRIGIAGITGRMGRLLAEEVTAAGAALAGGSSRRPAHAGLPFPLFADVAALAPLCDVVIDFTHADTAFDHAAILMEAGVAWVLGTTGLSTPAQAAVDRAADRIAVVQAANFSPGITLALDLAARMAAALPAEDYDAEIVEMHHRQKVDAPSGTALALGRAIAEARDQDIADVRDSVRDGHTGPRRAGAIGFATLRGGQIVGEHTLSFTAAGEQIALSHRAFDRRIFANGAVRAAIWCARRPAGLYDMPDVLGLR